MRFLLLAILVIPTILFSQVTVLGIVTDAADKTSLPEATIRAGNQAVLADLDGKFSLTLSVGRHTIECSMVGYKTYSEQIEIKANQPITLTIALEVGNILLETATVTSGKFERPVSQVTVSLDVIKPDLVQSVNTSNISTVLDKVPGVSIIDGQANIRGGSGFSYGAGSRVLLLVDDIPALQADAGYPNWADIPVENIAQIEVVKGAASALYGSSAMNGIINVRTSYAKNDPETHFSLYGTNYLDPADPAKKWWTTPRYSTGVSLLHKRKIGKLDLVASIFYKNEDEANEITYSKYGRATVGLRYRATDNLSFGANINYNKGGSSSFLFWANDSLGAYRPSAQSAPIVSDKIRYFIDPYIQYYDGLGNRHKLMGRLYHVDNVVTGGKSNQSDLFYGEYQFQRNLEKYQLVTTAGLVYSGTNVDAELYGDTLLSSANAAAYLQFDKKIGKKLNLSGGVRYEYNEQHSPEIFAGDTIPGGIVRDARPVFRIGANYQIGKATFLRASWGQGYRYPTVAERFIQTSAGFQIFPNPSVQSEQGWSTEIGVKQGIALGSGWQGYADAALFWSQYYDMLEYTFIFPSLTEIGFQSQNIGNTDIKGAEISLVGFGKVGKVPVSIFGGYTYVDPQFLTPEDFAASQSSDTTNILKYRFRHILKCDIEATLFKHLAVGAAFNYNSRMVNIDALFESFIPGVKNFRDTHNGYQTLDIRAGYKFDNGLKINLIAANTLNEEYAVRPGLLAAPRNISCRLDWKF